MSKSIHVLDTNVIIGFASDFEVNHDDCQSLFSLNVIKKTCLRVINELSKLSARRNKLYNDVKKYIRNNNSVVGFKPSIPLNKNDAKHLNSILSILSAVPNHRLIKIIDTKIREIQSGIREARNKLQAPSIPLYDYVALEASLQTWVENPSDACIISDSVFWAEEQSENIILCSNDFSDIIHNRDDIYYCVCGFRPYEFRDKPFEICSVQEILMK